MALPEFRQVSVEIDTRFVNNFQLLIDDFGFNLGICIE